MPPSPHGDSHRIDSEASRDRVLDATALRSWPLPVDDSGDKTTRGSVLVVGGSQTTAGAVLLAGIAALRLGAGRLQLATVGPAAMALSVAVPEAMVIPLPLDRDGCVAAEGSAEAIGQQLAQADAVLIGPGFSRDDAASDLLASVLPLVAPNAVIVLDAGAMTSMHDVSPALLAERRGRLIVTPNREELNVLLGRSAGRAPSNGSDGVVEAAEIWGAVVTSFGVVADPEGRRWTMEPATPGLGTSGSGDVLAGMTVGAAARCGDPLHAACWATFVHAESGNRLSRRLGRLGFLARELLEEAPLLLADLEQQG